MVEAILGVSVQPMRHSTRTASTSTLSKWSDNLLFVGVELEAACFISMQSLSLKAPRPASCGARTQCLALGELLMESGALAPTTRRQAWDFSQCAKITAWTGRELSSHAPASGAPTTWRSLTRSSFQMNWLQGNGC